MKWLPGLIVERECLEMDRSWRGSYSGSYGSLGTQYALNGLMYKISMYGGSQGSLGDIKWLPGLIGDTERTKMARSWRGSYSGSYGSLGTQNTWNGEMYRMLKYGGPWGSMGMDNALNS